MRRSLGAAVALAVALALSAGPEAAVAARKAHVKVEINKAKVRSEGGVKIKGDVSSSRKGCKKNRKVSVYHDVDPKGPGPEDFFLGMTTTDEDGDWKLVTPFLPDKVYATVEGKRKCKADVSKTEPVVFD